MVFHFKPKIPGEIRRSEFAPAFPMVTIAQSNPGNIVTAATIEHTGLVAAPAEAAPARLMEEIEKAHENGEGYAKITSENAAAAVKRRPGIKPTAAPR